MGSVGAAGTKRPSTSRPAATRHGLLGLIQQAEMDDPLSGAWFVFRNRQGDKLKIIYFEGDGLAIWYKRLEQGRFQWPPIAEGQASVSIDASQLRLILEGIDLTSVRRRKRWSRPSAPNDSVPSTSKASRG